MTSDRNDIAPAVQARDLTKRLGDFQAVRGVAFEVRQWDCFGFLGPDADR